jgi:hypothetical protein
MSENMAEALFISIGNLKLDPPCKVDLGECSFSPLRETDPEVQGVVNLGLGTPYDFRYPSLPCEYVLETKGMQKDIERAVMRTLAAFRLFKDSQIVCELVVVGKPPRGSVSFRHFIPWSRIKIDPYYLRDKEQNSFAEFWRKSVSLNPMNFATLRFVLADFRPYLYDRFTDYVESLEYLFVPDSAGGEIRYKFSSRVALILGRYEAGSRRLQIYEEMKDAYDMRSAIVHGTVPGENELTLGERRFTRWEDANELLRQYCRDAILFFFKRACLEDRDRRKQLLEKMLISDPRIVE